MEEIFGTLYKVRPHERIFWSREWVGPDQLHHGEKTLLARFTKPADSDGCDVEVFCEAMPARFYEVAPLDEKGITLRTGSGMHRLARDMAEALACGMLVVSKTEGKGVNHG